MNFQLVFGLLAAYLLGSIPSAVLYGTFFHQLDVRQHGSGNAGATNVFRVLGKRAGTIVLLVDILKGSLAVLIVQYLITQGFINPDNMIPFQLAFGFMALLGHLFPVFSQFKGGKGVATFLGIMLVIQPQASLISVLVFLLVFMIWHYVSLASIIASWSLPFSLFSGLFGETHIYMLVLSVLCAILITWKHRENIKRILRNDEGKMYLFKAKK